MADVLLTRQSVIFAKTETTYGTDIFSGTVAATDAILSTIPEFSFDVETYERNLARESLSPLAPRVTNVNCALSFSCELRGSGAAGTAPEIGDLLEACGFVEEIKSSNSVAYSPDSTSGSTNSSCTIYMYQGDPGQLKKITGCIGNVSFSVEQGGIGVANFEFQGKYDGEASYVRNQPIPDATYDTTLPPIAQNIGFSYGTESSALDINAIELNMNNEVQNVKSMNNAGKTATNFYLSGRAPTGSFNPLIENGAPSEFVIENLENSTAKQIQFNLGATAGNIVEFFMGGTYDASTGNVANKDAVTLTNIGFEDSDGLARYNCEFALSSSFAELTGDEVVIKYT